MFILQPVYLKADLRTNAGTIACCDHTLACLPDKCQCCHLFASIKIIVHYSENARSSFPRIPVDSNFLHEPLTKDMLSHEPYTPESVDSHSPAVLDDSDLDKIRKNSVSADQLKHKLEKIISMEQRRSPRLMKRSASESVETVKYKDGFFRSRAMSEVSKSTRAKLIPTTKAASLQRLQSHHSSSDEEWFEFDNDTTPAKSLDECTECSDEVKEEIDTTVPSTDEVPIPDKKKKSKRKCSLRIKAHHKNDCCCVT